MLNSNLSAACKNIRRENDLYILETEQGEIETRAVINAAGVHADEIHDMLLPHAFTITPAPRRILPVRQKRGQFG